MPELPGNMAERAYSCNIVPGFGIRGEAMLEALDARRILVEWIRERFDVLKISPKDEIVFEERRLDEKGFGVREIQMHVKRGTKQLLRQGIKGGLSERGHPIIGLVGRAFLNYEEGRQRRLSAEKFLIEPGEARSITVLCGQLNADGQSDGDAGILPVNKPLVVAGPGALRILLEKGEPFSGGKICDFDCCKTDSCKADQLLTGPHGLYVRQKVAHSLGE